MKICETICSGNYITVPKETKLIEVAWQSGVDLQVLLKRFVIAETTFVGLSMLNKSLKTSATVYVPRN